ARPGRCQPGAGAGCAFLVRVSRGQGLFAPVGWRDRSEVQWTETALSAARREREVLVAESSALEGQCDGGWTAGTHAGGVCHRQDGIQGRRYGSFGSTQGSADRAVLNTRPDRGARPGDEAVRALADGGVREANRQPEGGRLGSCRHFTLGAFKLAGRCQRLRFYRGAARGSG